MTVPLPYPAPKQPSTLRRAVSLKPFGSNLLTPGGSNWILVARTIVLLMASAEALSWGYLGALFLNGWARFFSGFLAGSFIFLVIWGIDASLMTLDRSRPLYERVLYRREPENPRWDKAKEYLGFVGRWVIVISSLTITAPFLAQIIFNVDIREEMEVESARRIDTTRAGIERRYAGRIGELESALVAAQARLEQEIAGRLRTGSGLYGEGPVARSIRAGLVRDSGQLAEARSERQTELEAFQRAVATHSDNTLRDRWGLLLPENSVIERGKILAAIVQVPTYLRTELAIKAFLAFLFIALFILKMFEPRSVKVYLSETLQQEWTRYKAGAFDTWLAREEKSTARPSAMTPLRFEDLMVNVYPEVRAEDLGRRKSSRVQVQAEDAESAIAELRAEMLREAETSRARERELESAIVTLQAEYAQLGQQVAETVAMIGQLEDTLKHIADQERVLGNGPEDDEASRIELMVVKVEAQAALRRKQGGREELQRRQATSNGRLSRLQRDQQHCADWIRELQDGLGELNTERASLWRRKLRDAADRGHGRATAD